MQKRIRFYVLMIVLAINVGGCTSSQSAAPKTEIQHATTKSLEKLDDAVDKEDTTNEADSDKPDTDQNASESNGGKGLGQVYYDHGDGSYTPTKIEFLTEDDFKTALNQLMILGYLNETSLNEQNFKVALSQFQKDQGLNASGQLDVKTIKSLDANVNH